jgi:integrase
VNASKPRRSKGLGTVYYSERLHCWIGQADLGYRNGRRWRPTVRGKTQREAQQKLAKLIRDHESGTAPPPGKSETVGVFLTRWLETVQRISVEPSTYVSHEVIVRKHLAPALGHLTLAKLQTADVQRYVADKTATHAAGTVRLQLSVLRHALETAIDWNLLVRNPAQRVKLPKAQPREYPVFDKAAGRRFLVLVANERLAALYVLGLVTGMRIGECLGLQWAAVDLERGVLQVRRKMLHLKGQLLEDQPKSPGSVREVPLHPLAVTALKRHKAQQAEARLLLGEAWERPDLVFTSPLGKPLWDRPISSYALPRLLERAGLPRISFHDLRHSFASIALSEGADVAAVSKLLGHASPAITMTVYRHVLPGEKRKAGDILGGALEEVAEE